MCLIRETVDVKDGTLAIYLIFVRIIPCILLIFVIFNCKINLITALEFFLSQKFLPHMHISPRLDQDFIGSSLSRQFHIFFMHFHSVAIIYLQHRAIDDCALLQVFRLIQIDVIPIPKDGSCDLGIDTLFLHDFFFVPNLLPLFAHICQDGIPLTNGQYVV